jgi:2-polyprenyl-3-methyl-5-hydroxy-6-metoxy-1,4-benzoquinol methylase
VSALLEPNQRQLLAALQALGLRDRTVLEIGCGRAPLHAQLVDAGANVVGVELQQPLLDAARAGADARRRYLHGDFVALADEIGAVDVALLDKVVHCYGDPEALVRRAAQAARIAVALSFPRNVLWLRCLLTCVGPVMGLLPGLRSLPFRVRFTRPETVRGWLLDEGLRCRSRSDAGPWHTEFYVRDAAAPA